MRAAKSILCAIDLSPGSERVLSQAAEFAELMAAELTILFVYRVPLLPLEEGEDGDEVVQLLGKVDRELASLSEPLRARGIKVKTLTLEGDASDTILSESQRLGAWLIVVGTHGRSGIKHLVLGSTAERVVRTSRIPVVTVPVAS